MPRTPTRFPKHGPDLRALLAACHAEPTDDTPRLVLADWLQEHDDPRGELVRLQCRLAAMPAGDPEYDSLFEQHEKWWRKYQHVWEHEVGTLMWAAGPHDRGLPTLGRYSNYSCRMSAEALGEPKAERLSATIATGWPGMTWALARDLRGTDGIEAHFFTDYPEQIAQEMFRPFHEPPWSGSPTPVGIAFPVGTTVTPAMIDCAAQVPNLSGLSLSETSAPVKLLPRIATLTQLEHLDLGAVRLTDDGLKALAPLARLRTLVSNVDRITDAGAEGLARFPELRELRLATSRFTAAAFGSIGRLTKLEVLDVRGADDAAVEHLRDLTRLRTLDLAGSAVSGRGLEQFPLLTDLNLCGSRIDDAGMSHLAKLSRLRALDVSSTPITGAGIDHLAGLPHLRDLDVSRTRLVGANLRHLAALPGLKWLYLFGTKIKDADLVHLEGLTGLEHIGLTGSRVTEVGAERLKKKLTKTAFQT